MFHLAVDLPIQVQPRVKGVCLGQGLAQVRVQFHDNPVFQKAMLAGPSSRMQSGDSPQVADHRRLFFSLPRQ
jgi:hypothetical protein